MTYARTDSFSLEAEAEGDPAANEKIEKTFTPIQGEGTGSIPRVPFKLSS